MYAQLAPRSQEMLRHHDVISIKVAVTCPHHKVRICIITTNASCRVASAHDQRWQPRQSKLAFFQQPDTARKVSILVSHYRPVLTLFLGWPRVPCPIEDSTDITYFQAPPERYGKAILKCVVVPNSRRSVLVQVVIRYHECAIILHIRRRHLQQARAAVGKLGARYTRARQDENNDQKWLYYCLDCFQIISV